jgi:hypothetical protein
MAMYASWAHGNALTVESPENLMRVGYLGWGAHMQVRESKSTWFHIPIPTPVIVGGKRTSINRVFLLFETEGTIDKVHVYDGPSKIEEFNNLSRQGNHLLTLGNRNTFPLTFPHNVKWGIGISFFFTATGGFEGSSAGSRLILGSAGADFSDSSFSFFDLFAFLRK